MTHAQWLTQTSDVCRFCKDIATKRRKRAKEVDNIVRWQKEDGTFTGSIAKARAEVQHLDEAIKDLELRRPSVIAASNNKTNQAPAPTSHAAKPPQLLDPGTGDPGHQQNQSMLDRVNRHAGFGAVRGRPSWFHVHIELKQSPAKKRRRPSA
ncbi:uncharacterized protein AB675_11545 [Cyphellophora attinorum]|uniref:Uncharacterized protein n=1 Tax=Cyphellophora attinorum TaxID=1664694 RepID=A0A0N1P0I5_9EURO|nr:uncharacterized protein AB675_11545 [Phialophora attinorum]KPI40065.1 hypothetical protein AB675_11545 [Phialophora attinorum]